MDTCLLPGVVSKSNLNARATGHIHMQFVWQVSVGLLKKTCSLSVIPPKIAYNKHSLRIQAVCI